MVLVLTMAGLYSRFQNEGFKFPKYLLPWGERTILSRILLEMTKGRNFSDIFLVGNVRDENYVPHIHATLRSHAVEPRNLVLIKDTKGQAETANLGLAHVLKIKPGCRVPIVFHNIDTILYGRDYAQIASCLQSNDGFIDVFSSNNHAYSYVLADESGAVKEVAEKTVISNVATSGLYGFATALTYLDHYKPEDIYITAVYKRMLSQGCKILTGPKHSEDDTVVLGTPAEYINASMTVAQERF
jgi:NDP-sugar pyrophosphorylase family protein